MDQKLLKVKDKKVVCHVCKRKVSQQNYKRHIQNKHPNEKGSDIGRGWGLLSKVKK